MVICIFKSAVKWSESHYNVPYHRRGVVLSIFAFFLRQVGRIESVVAFIESVGCSHFRIEGKHFTTRELRRENKIRSKAKATRSKSFVMIQPRQHCWLEEQVIITPTDRPALYSAFLRSVSFVLASSLSRILRFFQAKNVSSVTLVWLAPKAARSRSIKSSKDISSFLSSFFLSCQQVIHQWASTRSWLKVCPKWHILLPFWAQIQVAVHVDKYKWYHWGTPKTNRTCFSRQHSRRTYKSVHRAQII